MSVKERLIDFISFSKISTREFERRCSLSNGYVKGIKHSVLPDKLQSISLQFPELNTSWLLTGEGEMLKPTASIATPSETNTVAIPLDVWAVIKDQAASLKAKDEQIGELIKGKDEQMNRALNIIEEQVKKSAGDAESVAKVAAQN